MTTPIQHISAAPAEAPPPRTASIIPLAAPAAGPVPGSAAGPQPPEQPFSAFGSISQFRDAQRMATMLTHCSIVPENYRGDEHLGDCVIALEIANRIGASILAVMQHLRLVLGKPGWSSQFLISCLNATKRFSPIRYQMTGTRGEDDWGCIAWAIDRTGEVLKGPEVTLKMAKEEGWFHRPDSKWKTMPELMLCYRSATLFTRLYAPEITMGIQTAEEVVDMGPEGNGHPSRPIFEAGPARPNFEPKSLAERPDEALTKFSPSANSSDQEAGEVPAPKPTAAQVPIAPCPAAAPPKAPDDQYNYLRALTGLISLSKHSEANVLTFLRNTHRCNEAFTSLAEVADKQPGAIVWAHDSWKSVDRELTRLKKGRAA